MIVVFDQEYLKELYQDGKAKGKKYRFQPQVVRGYQKCIKYLSNADKIEDLYPIHSLNFEALHGDKEGRFSVRANGQYRVEFTVHQTSEETVLTICNILDLSNHYK